MHHTLLESRCIFNWILKFFREVLRTLPRYFLNSRLNSGSVNITFKISRTSSNHSDGHLQSILRCTSCIHNLSLLGSRYVRPKKIHTSPIKYNDRPYDVQIILGQVRAQGLRPRMPVAERFLDPLFRGFETESVLVRDSLQK